MGWQWHQLDYMQIICISFQTDNYVSTSSLNFVQAQCSSWYRKYHFIRAALRSRCGHYIFVLLLLSFFSSPNLSGRRLDVYHTSTHGVALVRIQNAGMKCAASGSLEMQDPKNRHLGTIAQICRAISSQLRLLSTIGKKTC